MLANQDIDEAALATIPGEQYMLVLDDDAGRLAVAAHLTLDDHRGHLRFLAVANNRTGERLATRMLDVIESICEAFGASSPVHAVERGLA